MRRISAWVCDWLMPRTHRWLCHPLGSARSSDSDGSSVIASLGCWTAQPTPIRSSFPTAGVGANPRSGATAQLRKAIVEHLQSNACEVVRSPLALKGFC
jgi:hypothetical protein